MNDQGWTTKPKTHWDAARTILTRREYDWHTLKEQGLGNYAISSRMGINISRVHQLRRTATHKLQAAGLQ